MPRSCETGSWPPWRANSAPSFYARLLNELLGLKIKVVLGYPGQNEAYLAMQRSELDSYGVTFWSSLTSTKSDWIRDKKIRILVQYGPEKEAALPDVPYGPDLVKMLLQRLHHGIEAHGVGHH